MELNLLTLSLNGVPCFFNVFVSARSLLNTSLKIKVKSRTRTNWSVQPLMKLNNFVNETKWRCVEV